MGTWQKYFEAKCCDIFIVNYESLKKFFVLSVKDDARFTMKSITFDPRISLFRSVIIDESHKCKSTKTQQSKFTEGICKGKEFILELTGTPVVNDNTDLIQQLKIMFSSLKPWKPVKDVLNFKDEGETIFREKPLAEKTLERIYAGLIKFVAGGKDAFLVKYNSMSRTGKYNPPGVNEPCPVVSTQNRLGIAQVAFISKYFGGNPYSKNVSVDGPSGSITTVDHHVFIPEYAKYTELPNWPKEENGWSHKNEIAVTKDNIKRWRFLY